MRETGTESPRRRLAGSRVALDAPLTPASAAGVVLGWGQKAPMAQAAPGFRPPTAFPETGQNKWNGCGQSLWNPQMALSVRRS